MPSFQMRAVFVCLLAAGCGTKEASSKTEEAPRFPVASPDVRDVVIEREYIAEIRAVRRAELRSRFRGVLESVTVDEGQPVTAGKTVFTVSSHALKQEVLVARAATLGAEAELKAAQLELQNTKLLQEKNVVSSAELALAESKVQTLRAKVAEAKANAERAAVQLSYAEVKAPFDGSVNRIPRRTGSAVAEDELLTTITDTSEVFAYFRITERENLEYLSSASGGKPRSVSLKLVDGTMLPSEGVVDAIESEVDRETGTLAYRARFSNPESTLRHGSSGKVVIKTEVSRALLVPQKSTFDVQGDIYVYVLDDKNVTHVRKLGIRTRHADAFVVERGLAESERFVSEGVQKLKDGMRIEIAATAAAHAPTVGGR